MKNIVLKNGANITIRAPKEEDAFDIVSFYNDIGGETDFLSFGANEYPLDVEGQKKAICANENDKVNIMILAFSGERIVGIITLNSSPKRRRCHVAELGIGIRLEFCQNGLGKMMMEEAINLARANGVTKKIALITRSDNAIATAAYEKLGFITEGIAVKDTFENNQYYNSVYMGLWL